MQKMDKRDLIRREEIKTSLTAAHTAMQNEWPVLEAAIAKYNSLIDAYNAALEDARGFADDCNNAIEEYMSDKSEKWQEGERGQAFEEWRQEFENASFDDIEHIDISDLEPTDDDPEAVETLEGLPEEPSV